MPRVFDRYELIERIGVGGMAEVFRARGFTAKGTPVTVVLKRILPHHCQDEQFRDMFIDEARVTATLKHPNLVRLLDFGHFDETLFIAMEYVNGANLEQILERCARLGRPFGVANAVYVVREVLAALSYAHDLKHPQGWSLDIVHRDVSLANVLVSREGTVKLTDFGIAKSRGRFTQTNSGTVKGNILFMAPEQVLGQEVDVTTDVYGAGMVLYSLLAGRNPYEGAAAPEIARKILAGGLPPPSQVARKVPPDLDEVVMRAINVEPGLRHPSAAEMERALRAIAAREGWRQDWAALLELVPPEQEPASEAPRQAVGSPAPRARTLGTAMRSNTGDEDTGRFKSSGPHPASDLVPPPPDPPADRTSIPALSLPGHDGPVYRLALGADGVTLYSAGADGTVRVWDIVSRAEVRSLRVPGGAIVELGVIGGNSLLTATEDGSVRTWSLEDGRERTVAEPEAPVSAIAIDPLGRRVALAHPDALRVHDLSAGTVVRRIDLKTQAAAVHLDLRHATAAGADGRVRTWSLETGAELAPFKTGRLRQAAFAPRAPRMAAVRDDGSVRYACLTSRALTAALSAPGATAPTAIAVGRDGTRVAVAWETDVRIWEPQSSSTRALRLPQAATSLLVMPGGKLLMAGFADGGLAAFFLAS